MTKGQKKSELILYLVLWTVLFAAPVVSMLLGDFFTASSTPASTSSSSATLSTAIDWHGVLNAWELMAMFFVTFLIHNFLVAPLLVYRGRRWAYGIAAFALVACFTLYQLTCRPHQPEQRPDDKHHPQMEQPKEHVEGMRAGDGFDPGEDHGAGGARMVHEIPHEMPPPEPTNEPPRSNEPPRKDNQPRKDNPSRKDNPPRRMEPPKVFGGQDSVALIIMLLLLGLNVGVKYFFKSLDDKKRIKELERENLNRQLEYLKYQINPHFFMNTLNNIHALVDIDPEQAKYTIEVLSKLMRYVLYEGNKTMAPLQKELDFIRHYVDLMRIRYTDKVRISVSLPTTALDIQVPSLLFTTFVENAFKHGVSYQRDSFIEVSVSIDEASREVAFCCINSRKPEKEEGHGGVGLTNAKKRLRLIYGDDYELSVNSNEEEYRLLLRLPFEKVKG